MAAFVFDRILRVDRRRSVDLSETFKTLSTAACEWLTLLWMLVVTAFSLLMAAGAMGLLA